MIRIRHPRLYLVAAVLFVLFGYATMRITLELVQGPSFAVTEGKVTHAAWHSSMSRTGRSYFVDISYDYVVDGRQYHSDHYFGAYNRAVGQRPCREIVAQHPVGSKVVVHYDPKDPKENYVVLPKEYWRIALYGLLTVIVPGGIIWMDWVMRHRPRRRRLRRRRWPLRDIIALLLFVLCIIAGLSLMAGLARGFVEVVRLCRRGSPWGYAWVGLSLLAVVALGLWRRATRKRAYQELLVRGVDCGLTEESMRAVDALLQEGGKLCRRKPSQALVLAPGIREFANRYSSVRCRGVRLFANRLTEGAFSPKGDSDWYYVIGCEDEESLYCVKKSAADETVYYIEIEWMPAPVPYASDIRHYLALRYQEKFCANSVQATD